MFKFSPEGVVMYTLKCTSSMVETAFRWRGGATGGALYRHLAVFGGRMFVTAIHEEIFPLTANLRSDSE